MRGSPVLLLVLVGLALSACKGGGNSASLGLCGLNCPPPADDDDGGGDDTVPPGDDTTPGDGDNSGGNETSLSSGDTTIALESGKLVQPEDETSLSRLTVTASPSKAKLEVDTKTGSNNTWLEPQEMDEYTPGSNANNIFSPANLGAASYKEYRNISGTGLGRDEELQVWNFGNSYATQYRNVAGGVAVQQAYSFGGARTAIAEMPASASATYAGRFGTTAAASNWIDPDQQVPEEEIIARNNSFATNGSASINADFGAQTVQGTLQTERVRFHNGRQFLNYDVATGKLYTQGGGVYQKANANGVFVDAIANAPDFYRTPIRLNGTITGNTYQGVARLGDGFVNADNPMYGGFFGPNAAETTGAFSVRGVAVGPIGGEYPIENDRRGYLSHTGIFNAGR